MREKKPHVRPEKTGVRAPLGDLEAAVMRVLWDEHGGTGSAVQKALDTSGRKAALTTVLTTLDRLAAKDILRKEPDGRATRYIPVVTEEELESRIVSGVLDSLITQFPRAVATYFAGQGAEDGSSAVPLEGLAARVRALQEAKGQDGD